MLHAQFTPEPELVGESPRIREIRHTIAKLGRSRVPVLVLGETGTGKEVVARAIHAVQRTGAFVTIDCSSLTGTLMESELFGHTKGAFTGAAFAKTGLLEAADGGTAFFDEIGELPLELQAKLLRALQEGEVRPVGSVAFRRVNFRAIAATNRDLAVETERGRFRRDLYYRLKAATVRLPPLRERKEDIPALVEHFLKARRPVRPMGPEVMELLLRYDWPGNVRELQHTLEYMLTMNSGGPLQPGDFPSALAGMSAAPFEGAAPADAAVAVRSARIVPLADLEKKTILEALEFTGGDRTRAARLLRIGRTTLYRKLRQYGLEGPAPRA